MWFEVVREVSWFWFRKVAELLFRIALFAFVLPFSRCSNEMSRPSVGRSRPIISNRLSGSGPSSIVDSCLLLLLVCRRLPCSLRLSRKVKTNCCCLLNGMDEKMDNGDFRLPENTIGSPLIFSPFRVFMKRTLLCVCFAVFEKLGTLLCWCRTAEPFASLLSANFESTPVSDPALFR